jgi:putative GTP pyrophosphokinase
VKHAVLEKLELQKEYEQHYEARAALMKKLEAAVEAAISILPSNVMVKGRVKSFVSLHKKINRYLKAGKEPDGILSLPRIPDLIGIRIVCPFIEDTVAAEVLIRDTYQIEEVERKGSTYSFKEFGYESVHIIAKIPEHMLEGLDLPQGEVVEIQIRTNLQEAWAEVEHELVYKAEFTPFDQSMKRKLAAINASLSLADTIFQEIRTYQRQLNAELGKRRTSFYNQIEATSDQRIFSPDDPDSAANLEKPNFPAPVGSNSIDSLLLNALYAHNKGNFDDAIKFYTKILHLKPDQNIRSLIFKHRGMAYFAKASYNQAVTDFTASLETDPASYKSYYYRGIVKAVLQDYEGAIDDFTAALDLYPYQAYTYFRRAQAHYHLEDYTEALADVESSLGIDSSIEEAQRLKVLLLKKLKM